jgi:hypothetical protein
LSIPFSCMLRQSRPRRYNIYVPIKFIWTCSGLIYYLCTYIDQTRHNM